MAAQTRQRNSAHSVANLLSENFHNRRTTQVERNGGGTTASTAVDENPQPVSLANEIVQQKLASVQAEASARVIKTSLDLQRRVLDIFG